MERILIIEDEESILMALTDDLVLEGYKVTGAGDGLQGLTRAKEKEHDLIILDIMLPKMDGYEVCRQARKRTGQCDDGRHHRRGEERQADAVGNED